MKTRIIPATDPHAAAYALDVLRQHGVVAFPTDTVYGLGAGVFDPVGIDRLYSIKGRDHMKAIAVLLAEAAQLSLVAVAIGEEIMAVARDFWPGPLTLVVPRHPDIPESISRTGTVGVRIPDHPVACRLMGMTGPMAVTSANRSGAGNTLTAQEVLEQLDGRIDLVLDGGKTPGGVPSTVLDCTRDEWTILRPGPISLRAVKQVLSGK